MNIHIVLKLVHRQVELLIRIKPDISKSKIRKIVISLQTSTDNKLRKLLNTVMAVDDKRIAPVEKRLY